MKPNIFNGISQQLNNVSLPRRLI